MDKTITIGNIEKNIFQIKKGNLIATSDEGKTTVVKNIQRYTQQIVDGNLILTIKVPLVDEVTLFQKNLGGSTILYCTINGVNNNMKKYTQVLRTGVYSIVDIETIKENTILNITPQERHDKGFKYYTHLGVSIQGADTRRILKEIINIIKIKNYNMELKIQLINDEVIRFVI
tara:strand:- start:973 stop:1491 length:519 start_codon:yes stop_codon:yes gene_type:complete